MGGCRCTYRNCKSISAKNMHLFHYPVYDKIRCHQWIVNARRFDFLNLTVAQLKNRVVCHHHFKDDMFMNEMKNTLTYNAIPTEDGPNQGESTIAKEIPSIIINNCDLLDTNEIEVDAPRTKLEKLATSSKRYVEYLTNCEISIVPESLLEPVKDKEKKKVTESKLLHAQSSQKSQNNTYTKEHCRKSKKSNETTTADKKENIEVTKQATTKTNPQNDQAAQNSQPEVKKQNKIEIISQEVNPDLSKLSFKNYDAVIVQPNDLHQQIYHSQSLAIDKESKKEFTYSHVPQNQETCQQYVITNADGVDGNTILIEIPTPNFTLSNIIAKEQINEQSQHEITKESHQEVNVNEQIHGPKISTNYIYDCNNASKSLLTKSHNVNRAISKSGGRQNLSPDKKADIDRKRRFNMKLREIVEESLQKLENGQNTLSKNITKEYGDMKMSYLVSKVEENSNEIRQLKNLLLNSQNHETKPLSVAGKNNCKNTQTYWTEASHKKYLYEELSQYLSSEAKSLVFEELFLSEVLQVPKRSKRSRKK